MRKVVVGYDGSESAHRALERVAELAGNGAEVTVVSVPPITFTSLGPLSPGEATLAQHRRQLAEACELLASRGIGARTVETVGLPAEVILSVAKRDSADLIVVGTGRKNVGVRLVLGSVSETVLHHAPCDVLVVR